VSSSTPAPTLRQRVETVSRPLLVRLTNLPRLLIPLGTVLLIGLAMLAPLPVGLAALAVVALFILWIAYLAWPAITAGGRVARLVVLALVLLVAVARITGRL
jgi:hypothetical protein